MKFGVIGVGNMAGAIVESILNHGLFQAEDMYLFDVNPEKVDSFSKRGLNKSFSAVDVFKSADLILLAVKPQQIDSALSELVGFTNGKCIVSIVTGVSSEYIKSRLGNETYIVRVMPNTPIMLGCGATAITTNKNIPDDLYKMAVEIFASAGVTAFVEEANINAITCVNGSSPAYFFVLADAMVKAAAEQGIDAADALRLAAKSMEGAALMLQKSGKTPEELTAQVTSPGGTTLAALAEMQRLGFTDALRAGMLACTKRAFEIGK